MKFRLICSILFSMWGTMAFAGILGPARVVDGDTLVIGESKIRLFGVDTPERGQRCLDGSGEPWYCGAKAMNLLDEKIKGKEVFCEPHKRKDRYNRTLARCFLGEIDLNRWLVMEGIAVAYGKDHLHEQRLAKKARKGLWSGVFIAPKEWRKNNHDAELMGLEIPNMQYQYVLYRKPKP